MEPAITVFRQLLDFNIVFASLVSSKRGAQISFDSQLITVGCVIILYLPYRHLLTPSSFDMCTGKIMQFRSLSGFICNDCITSIINVCVLSQVDRLSKTQHTLTIYTLFNPSVLTTWQTQHDARAMCIFSEQADRTS